MKMMLMMIMTYGFNFLQIYLADFLITNLTKFACHLSEKASKGRFLKHEKLQSHTNEGKGKEKKKERGEGKEEKKKKINGCTLSFYNRDL